MRSEELCKGFRRKVGIQSHIHPEYILAKTCYAHSRPAAKIKRRVKIMHTRNSDALLPTNRHSHLTRRSNKLPSYHKAWLRIAANPPLPRTSSHEWSGHGVVSSHQCSGLYQYNSVEQGATVSKITLGDKQESPLTCHPHYHGWSSPCSFAPSE